MSVRVPQLGDSFPEKRPTATGHFSRAKKRVGHGRVGGEVTGDNRLKDSDVRVYAALAFLERGGMVTVGLRLIAMTASKSKSQAARSIDRLVACGHVEKSCPGDGKRTTYRLTSSRFWKGKRAAESVSNSEPEESKSDLAERPKVTLVRCVGCATKCKPNQENQGYCRTCLNNMKIRRMVDDAVNRKIDAVRSVSA